MKIKLSWIIATACAAAALIPGSVKAQTVVAIGNISKVEDATPILWGIGGLSILTVKYTDGGYTPIMRTEVYDARTVEILCRTQAPKLTWKDVHVISRDGKDYIVVRKYLLMEVKNEDAGGEKMSRSALADKWAKRLSQVLPAVAPVPSDFGV